MLRITIISYSDNNHNHQDNHPNSLNRNPNKSIKLNQIKSKKEYIDVHLL